MSVQLPPHHNRLSVLFQMAVYLFSGLYLHLWHPQDSDLETLMSFLQEEPSAVTNQLARTILSGLNWLYNTDCKELFLTSRTHHEVAVMVTKCCAKYDLERRMLGLVSRSLKQVNVNVFHFVRLPKVKLKYPPCR